MADQTASPIGLIHVRISLGMSTEENDAKVLAYLRETYPCHFIVREEPDDDVPNPHWHCAVHTKKTKDNVRQQLTNACPWLKQKRAKGVKTHHAVSVILDTNFYKYMCKGSGPEQPGGLPVRVSAQAPVTDAELYTTAWVKLWHHAYWVVHAAYKKASADKRKSMLQRCHEAAEAQDVTSLEDIIDLVMRQHDGADKSMYINHMEAIARAVWYRRNKQEAASNIAKMLAGRLQFLSPY